MSLLHKERKQEIRKQLLAYKNMQNYRHMQINAIEPTSYLWCQRFADIYMPADGIVIEVAPGYEPKIGNALALLGFYGTIFLIEPDTKAAYHIQCVYRKIMPQATVRIVMKPLHEVRVGVDVPFNADALMASHPFDDMVIASLANQTHFFSREKEKRTDTPLSLKKLYDALTDKDYARGIKIVTADWQQFIKKSKPGYFVASQYPSRTLMMRGLIQRQNSGFVVLKQLKKMYKHSLAQQCQERPFGYKGDPKWWIVAKNPYENQNRGIGQGPFAISRLGKSIFIPQRARRLRPKEYDIVYVDKEYFKNRGHDNTTKRVRDFAIVLDGNPAHSQGIVTAYADRQKDKTDISLSGNRGSGRAVYYGDRFQILGVGKTTLCKSTKPSHSTGQLELIGAMRRIILSKWINHFTQRAPEHIACIALKKTARFKWNFAPIPLCLLVRVDDSDLDRPSHIEQSPRIPIDFEKTLSEYARLDAEYFAYRILFGAWSTNNYSLAGRAIDLESVSFVKYRGPYYTSSSRYPHNRFGYEGLGFLKILHQLAGIKNIQDTKINSRFYKERHRHLGFCFLMLLGVSHSAASNFFLKYSSRVMRMSDQFEKLSKKIIAQKTNLNLYAPIIDAEDPSLLDMSSLLRNLAKFYKSPGAETRALDRLIRKTILSQIQSHTTDMPVSLAEEFLRNHAVITSCQMRSFLNETRGFVHNLFKLLALLDSQQCLGKRKEWKHRLRAMNQNLPIMSELNVTLKFLAEQYRLGKISPKTLNAEINKLCALPDKI